MFEQDKTTPSTRSLPVRPERVVRNTPLDLRQRRFATAMRGFDKNEVVTFLSDVANDYEQVLQQLDMTHQELLRLEGLIHENKLREDNLRNTLMTAQKLADQIRDAAHHEAKIIVREAEARADLLLDKTQTRLEEIEREINELRLRRRDVEGSIEASISSLHHALEFVRSQDKIERDDRILLHRPRQPVENTPSVAPRLTEVSPASEAPKRRGEPEP